MSGNLRFFKLVYKILIGPRGGSPLAEGFYKGREDSLRSLPSFRTVRADLPHTALQLVLTPKRLSFQFPGFFQ